MSFDVASVKPSPANAPLTDASLPLDDSDAGPGKTVLFSANVPLFVYISFAYKLPAYETPTLLSQLPKWANADRFAAQARQRFEIQARAASPSTKDQMRLMVQSLLADRFKLHIHWERRQVPSYDLVLIKLGKTGPQLQPHNDKIPCQPDKPSTSGYPYIPGQTLPFCGRVVSGSGPGGVDLEGRGVTMAQVANAMNGAFGSRPVADKTGLEGLFDVNLDQKFHLTPTELQQFGIADMQSGYVEAFRDQLGLKFVPNKTFVETLVVDHVEEPSPN